MGFGRRLEELTSARYSTLMEARESGALGFECSEHSGIHLNSDYYVFEFSHQSEERAGGIPSSVEAIDYHEILITGLHNYSMPLIRYRQDDIVKVDEDGEKCGCGSYLPRLRQIQGRTDDEFVRVDGTRIPPGTIMEYIESVLQVRDYQLIQRSKDRVSVMLNLTTNRPQKADAISSYLRQILGEDVRLEFEEWKNEEMPAKYRPVVTEAQANS